MSTNYILWPHFFSWAKLTVWVGHLLQNPAVAQFGRGQLVTRLEKLGQ